MTRVEARIVLGLRENDTIDKAGLDMLKNDIEQRFDKVSKGEKSKMRRELKAIAKLGADYGM